MREKKKSGLFCCGQNLKKLRFYRGAMAVVSGLSLVGGLVLFSVVAQAAICFLPDCQDKPMKFEPSGADECLAAGYESTSSRICPENSNIIYCPENSSYIKCNLRQWCLDNGYTIVPDDCQVPQYADAQCPNGEVLYFQCKEDLEKACLEEDNDYVSDCQDGWTLDDTELCSYSDLYGKCCNLCADYPYEADEIPQGYQTGGSCLACGNVTRYQKELNDCAAQGFIQCDKGGQTGTEVCWRGDEKWYKECCAPCDDYPYLESQIPEGYVKGDSCDSCDGMKYKVKEGECGSGYVWENDTCVKVSCDVGYVLNSDMTCTATAESGKTPIGVISYMNGSTRLAINLVQTSKEWGGYGTDISGLTNITSSSTAKNDFSGKSNTSKIVSVLGSSSTSYAAGYCYNYTTAGTSKGQWYLPAAGELYASIVTNYSAVNSGLSAAGGTSVSSYHWSSSEYSYNYAWSVNATGGGVNYGSKNFNYGYVRCVLGFEDNGDGTGTLCGNDYLYTCTVGDDTHITGGVGVSCGGLYQSCQCAAGYEWKDGACAEIPCEVGDILNSDMTCTETKEDGKTPIGVISYASGSTRLAINLVQTSMQWGGYGTDISGLTNYSSSPHTTDFSGKSNTSIIVSALGDTSSYAAGYCYNYTTAGTSKGQWYLPAQGELYATVWTNKTAVNSGLSAAGGTQLQLPSGYWYWSSSEKSSGQAWYVSANDGNMSYAFKLYDNGPVRCVLGFEDNGDGTATVCGAEYKYSCDGENMTGGIGSTCGGLYQSCQCAAGYEWKDGVCEQPVVCEVGRILNSDMTCSASKVSGKTPIGVVSYINGSTRLAINLVHTEKDWGGYGTDISGLTNITSESQALNDFSGKSNTSIIVSALGDTSSYAAGYCYNYTTAGTSKGQWYLPAAGELYASIGTNYSAVNNGIKAAGGTQLSGYRYWSSSEYSSIIAWYMGPGDGYVSNDRKGSYYGSARCVLGFEDNGDGTATVCGAEYKYSCDGENMTGGIGSTCGGLYSACTCASGYEWKDGACVLSCDVGYVLNSDMTCTKTKEDGKTPIGVISYASGSTRLAINLVNTSNGWGGIGTDISGLTNYSSSPHMTDFNGKSNTSIIVSELGDTSDYAAGYCYNFTTAGTSKGDWYLPAQGELYATVWTNKTAVNSGLSAAEGTAIQDGWHWSSSEYNYLNAWNVGANGGVDYAYKGSSFYVRCVLAFEDNGNGTGTLCGNDYLYTCTVGDDTHITGGVGVSCGGLYQSCQCAAGYEWKDGVCEKSCDETCSVGNILYSDYTCSSCNVSGKTPIGVISYMNGSRRLAINLVNTSKEWGGYRTDISGLTNITSESRALNDFSGKSNTSKIVSVLGSSSTSYAAGYCYNFTTAGTSKGQWYLPAEGELYATVWTNKTAVNSGLSAAGGTAIQSGWHWSSSEYSGNLAWGVVAGSGVVLDGIKGNSFYVRCVLGFEDNGDGTGTLCGNDYLYTCTVGDDTHITGGVGVSCGGLYQSCQCAAGYEWKDGACVLSCDSSYKYTCSGANITGGSGTACGGKYTACTCNSPYTWSNGACSCPSTYQYTCSGTGYSGGSGSSCGGKYTACTCSSPYTWSSGACSCPTTYKYACTGTGYSGGVATACNGKYISCSCASGYEWNGAACVSSCPASSCAVGDILYSDKTCSSGCTISGKTPIGVVSYISGSTRLAINLVSTEKEWDGYGTDISGLTNITSSSTAKNDFSGKSNTSIIVSALGDTSSYAAGYCYNFTTAGTSKGDWYLPAEGELYATVWTNKTAVNSGLSAAGGTSVSGYHWSSSEKSSGHAWIVHANYGNVDWTSKYVDNFYVRCVLAF